MAIRVDSFIWEEGRVGEEWGISDWSSDVCSSDLCIAGRFHGPAQFLLAEIGNRPSSRFLAHKLLDIAPECFKRRHDTSRRLAGGRDVSGNRARHGFNGSLVVSPVLAKRPHGDKVRFL